jgi:hypothetical protein
LIEGIIFNLDLLYKKALNKKKLYSMMENFMRFKFYAIKPLVDEKKKTIIHPPFQENYWDFLLSRKTIN